MNTDLIGQRVAIGYHGGATGIEGVVRAIELSRKDFSADLVLVVQKDDGVLVTRTGGKVTVVKQPPAEMKIKDDMKVWVDKGKVCFEVVFEDERGFRLMMPPSTALELANVLVRNAEEIANGTP